MGSEWGTNEIGRENRRKEKRKVIYSWKVITAGKSEERKAQRGLSRLQSESDPLEKGTHL